ncbi:mitochondrial pyruvate carrier, partial [Lophiotrema nucula]
FARFWNSSVGPKTVHFWAPIMKWSIVLAGAADLTRPASQLSLTQNAALACTGAIWTRWCFVIRPQNIFLATVNFFLFVVGATQVTRILRYQQTLK